MTRTLIQLAALLVLCPLWLSSPGCAAEAPVVNIAVDASAGRRPISPYIYGRNGALQQDSADLVRASGLRITRESGGNNCTKYNWRLDLSSHPDWYNNVYKQGWPDRAQRLQKDFTDLQGLFGFQVLGWVAKTDAANFHEQEVNPRPDPHLSLCGGGKPELYLQPWTAKDTVDILDHWFGPGGLGLDPARFRYWHMDNEPGCWMSTHKDICPKDYSAEDCVRKYIGVAKEVKTRYPGVRLMAPGFTSEWMWWNWNSGYVQGMPWVEFFIKRMAEASKVSGVRLMDVVDFHTYTGGDDKTTEDDVLQEYRILYDPEYKFPRANGCKHFPDGGWHNEQQTEMIFARTEKWLDQYFGPGHGITIGVTEAGPPRKREMVSALWYASMLGTFADHGVEVFTPWDWRESWWEVLHLFSRHAGTTRVESRSDAESRVSAYSSLSASGKTLTVILLNRTPDATSAQVAMAGFAPGPGPHTTLQLAGLPEGVRTLKSETDNALRKGSVAAHDGGVTVALPPYSITAVVVEGTARGG